MSRKVQMKDNLPAECPKCESDDLCIDNVDGMERMKCGCWFDTEPDGQLIWIRAHRPAELDL